MNGHNRELILLWDAVLGPCKRDRSKNNRVALLRCVRRCANALLLPQVRTIAAPAAINAPLDLHCLYDVLIFAPSESDRCFPRVYTYETCTQDLSWWRLVPGSNELFDSLQSLVSADVHNAKVQVSISTTFIVPHPYADLCVSRSGRIECRNATTTCPYR